MSRRARSGLVAALALAAALAGTRPAGAVVVVQEEIDELPTSPFGGFAFADSTGTKVLSLSVLTHPKKVRTLLTADGRRMRVRYKGWQKRTDHGDGRDGAYNFGNLEGYLYRIEGGRVRPDETCFLATSSLLAFGRAVHLSRSIGPCGRKRLDATAVDAEGGRRLVECSQVARFDSTGRIALLEFAPRDHSLLTRLVVEGDGRTLTYDYPAHVLDGASVPKAPAGEHRGEAVRILFLVRGARGDVMAVSWRTRSGESLELLQTTPGQDLRHAYGAYRSVAAR